MKPTILIVDNDPEMVSLLQRHLEDEGWSTTSATSGSAAVGAMDRDEFDVILTDMVMDGMDGLAVLRESQARGGAPA